MLTLLQLIKLQVIDPRILHSFCEDIHNGDLSMDELLEELDEAGVELTDIHIKSLHRVCVNGSYKAAFALAS